MTTSFGMLLSVPASQTSIFSPIANIDFDVTETESHEWTNDVTTFPVEIGSPISDHIRPLPDKLVLTGMISDSPLSDNIISQFMGVINGDAFNPRSQTTFDFLRAMHEARETVTVYTKYRVYPDMAISSINIPRSAGIGMAVNFTIDFTHIRLVSTQSVDVPPGISRKSDKKAGADVQKKASATKNGGAKQPAEVKQSTSILSGIFGT